MFVTRFSSTHFLLWGKSCRDAVKDYVKQVTMRVLVQSYLAVYHSEATYNIPLKSFLLENQTSTVL